MQMTTVRSKESAREWRTHEQWGWAMLDPEEGTELGGDVQTGET